MTATSTRPFHSKPPPPWAASVRKDEDLADAVRARLHQSGYLALREISCEATNSRVVLRGRVSTFYLKQVAQARAGDVEGVRLVVNRIEVRKKPVAPPPHRPGNPPLGFDPSERSLTTMVEL